MENKSKNEQGVTDQDANDLFDEKQAQIEFDKFISNPENRQKATVLANQIKELVGKNWFTFERFVDKLKYNNEDSKTDAYQQLVILKSFGLCVSKVGDGSLPKSKRGKVVYKIVMDYIAQIDLIDHDIAYFEAKIQFLKQEREKAVFMQNKLKQYEVSDPDKANQGTNVT